MRGIAAAWALAATLLLVDPVDAFQHELFLKRQQVDQTPYLPNLINSVTSGCESMCASGIEAELQQCGAQANGSAEAAYECACSPSSLSLVVQCASCIAADPTRTVSASAPFDNARGFANQCSQLGYGTSFYTTTATTAATTSSSSSTATVSSTAPSSLASSSSTSTPSSSSSQSSSEPTAVFVTTTLSPSSTAAASRTSASVNSLSQYMLGNPTAAPGTYPNAAPATSFQPALPFALVLSAVVYLF